MKIPDPMTAPTTRKAVSMRFSRLRNFGSIVSGLMVSARPHCTEFRGSSVRNIFVMPKDTERDSYPSAIKGIDPSPPPAKVSRGMIRWKINVKSYWPFIILITNPLISFNINDL
jgi:hypothetical protein